jgi:hypothetical protein
MLKRDWINSPYLNTLNLPWRGAFLLFVALLGGNYMLYHLSLAVRTAYHVVTTAVILYTLYRYGLPRSVITFPLIAMWLSVFLSAVQASDTRMTFEFAWHWFTNMLMFLVAIRWHQRRLSDELFTFQFAAGAIIALAVIVEVLITRQRPLGMFLNISLTGAYCAALALPCLSYRHTSSHMRTRLLFYGMGTALVAATLLNQSRGALLSLGVSFFVLMFLRLKSFRARLFSLIIPLACLLAITVYSIQPNHANGDVIRLDLWQAASQFMESNPNGIGPGMFGHAYAALNGIREDRFTGAHNTILNIGAELGGFGLASSAALVLVFIWMLRSKRTLFDDAILASLCGITAHMLFDNFPADAWALLISLYAGYLIQRSTVHLPRFLNRLHFPKAAVTAFLVGYLVVMLRYDLAQSWYEQSLITHELSAAQQAAQLDPDNVLYRVQVARLEGGMEAAYQLDPVMRGSGNLATYSLLTYGRIFR